MSKATSLYEPHCSYIELFFDKAGNVTDWNGERDATFGLPIPSSAAPEREWGLFSRWRIDPQTGFRAENDPFGMYNLFYYHSTTRLIVSPSILPILQRVSNPKPNWNALNCFTHLGFFLGEDTPFEDIFVLPPNSILTWDSGALSVRGGDTPPEPITHTHNNFIEGYQHYFDEAITQILSHCGSDNPVLLPLSGGRDSRHILLKLLDKGYSPKCATVNFSSGTLDSEAQAAQLLCHDAKVPWITLPGRTLPLFDQLYVRVLTSLCSDECQNMLALRKYIQKTRAHDCLVFDGIAGDILSRTNSASRQRFIEYAFRAEYSHAAEQFIDDIQSLSISAQSIAQYTDFPFQVSKEDAVSAIAGQIALYSDYPCPGSAFLFYSRTRREISLIATGVLSIAKHMCVPFLYPPLVRFCLAGTYDPNMYGGIHDHIISRYYPYSTRIPYAETFSMQSGKSESRIKRGIAAIRAAFFSVRLLGGCGTGQLLLKRLSYGAAFRKRAAFVRWLTYSAALYRIIVSPVRGPNRIVRFIQKFDTKLR